MFTKYNDLTESTKITKFTIPNAYEYMWYIRIKEKRERKVKITMLLRQQQK